MKACNRLTRDRSSMNACEEYSQEVLRFYGNSKSANPTPISEPIIAKSSPSLTPFEGGDFILEEIEGYLASDSVPPGIDSEDISEFFSTFPIPVEDSDFFLEKPKTFPSELETFRFDIKEKRIVAKFLNNDPSSPILPKEIKAVELKNEKSLVNEPPKLELKDLPFHLEYAFLEGIDKLPIIIAKNLKDEEKERLIKVLKAHKQEIAWKLSDIKIVLGWIPMVFQISIDIDPQDQEKTTFTCPYGTFAYRGMPFGLCNAPGTFQRCMMAIFHDMIEETMEVFMDDFLVFGDSFSSFLFYLDKMLKRCEDTNLVLNWEKCHFMVKEGIVLGHKISKSGIEVDRAKVDVIAKLPHPTSVKGVRSFLGHAGFYH
ncbi:reverse transcriptase domain-containing protein [Tanacetum coccineum]